ncbi:SpoIID/LytB domain-containing protein [Tissierella sp.]|uniref:SpoIID/LytB domain-containing protein n=1 Tax=Tissierella sp. TaxID=41274 RepID=UPI0028587EDD|nr:SpoIID/LytB domain-containing protein [Tissierella sp.]MDR7856435.1 SpoIID/LytB domain-containing protein [Tissierella sp.]
MKKVFFSIIICSLIITIFLNHKSYADGSGIEYLNIKLTRPLVQKEIINMGSDSGFIIYNNNDINTIYQTIHDTTLIAILNENSEINLSDSNNNIIFTIPMDGSITIGSNNIDNPMIKIEKDRYRDFIRLINKNNEIIVINQVTLENYLYGLVPREMPSTFHIEALKAQAVASRTYAIYNINKHSSDGYNLCDTTHCQVYSGVDGEKPTTNLAVDETKGIFAYYNGILIDAQYHSTSSGYTEDSANIWGGDLPYLKSVEDDFSTEAPYSKWSLSINLLELNNKLIASGIDLGELIGIEAINTTATGKVDKLKIIGTNGEHIITATKFRIIVGTTSLKSEWFNIINASTGTSTTNKQTYVIDGNTLKPKTINLSKVFILDSTEKKTVTRSTVSRALGNDRVTSIGGLYPVSNSEIIIEGKGYGHGVGMSQYGAKKMAELGYSFEEILKHYYTGIDIF